MTVDLLYDKYSTPYDYFVALQSGYAIREKPNPKAKRLKSAAYASRWKLLAEVKGTDDKVWYRLDLGKGKIGYIMGKAGKARTFQLAEALRRAEAYKAVADEPNTVHITNYKNAAGKCPAIPGHSNADKYGNRRDQAAPALETPDAKTPSRYLPDGLVGELLASDDTTKTAQVYFPTYNETWYVPLKFLQHKKDSISELTQLAVVDRNNQNIIVLQYDGGWKIVSMSFVSTGKNTGVSIPTPLGDFVAQAKANKFYYYADGTTTIDGYAPYAVRFSAGGYLHGVPRNIKIDPDTGKMIVPGTAESNGTLGTTPQSHMCVRNYTSHALFMYKWIKLGKAGVIVIE